MRKIYYHIIILLFSNIAISSAQVNPTFEKPLNTIRLKLPTNITINNYDLKYHRFVWVIDPAQRYISGSVTSYFVATQDQMNNIQFQLSESLSADSALFNGKITSINHTGDIISIPLNPMVPIGKLDSITIYYHGVPGLTGFGSFENYVHNGTPSMWTLSEPYGASDWWPSKNDLTDKIDSIDVYVIMPKGNHCASNGLLISEAPYASNSTLAHWKHRYPIASYLIAIGVTNYARYSDYYKTESDSIEILNYVYPEDSLALTSATPYAVKSMALFEQLFTPYPFKKEKYGHAQCNFQGGMEHQTMTFLGKNQFSQQVITHELAHQWFGDMITCGSWEDIWLNEGFASYCQALSYEFLYKDNSWKNWINSTREYINKSEQGSVFRNDTSIVNEIFSNSLSYSKGAFLLHMLRWIVGDNDFFQGIRNYLNDPNLKYSFAHTSDLKKHLEDQSGKDLTKFFEDWFYGSGEPIYDIQINQDLNLNTSVTINQTQHASDISFFNMILPIKFKRVDSDTTIVLNHTFSGQTFDIHPGFRIDSVLFDPDNKILYYGSKVSLNQIENDIKVIIMPNPVSNLLQVQHKTGSINYLQIYNSTGKSEKVNVSKNEDTFLMLNIQDLQPGVYILKIGTSEWIQTNKFIVIK